ncbi:hypothetical protein [Dyadobacter chenwenxiniae]|nr:hypothetical protein [Dyadobacter chenwenxiniae]
MLDTILNLLRNEQNIFIRGFESGDGDVTAFLFTSGDGAFFEGG